MSDAMGVCVFRDQVSRVAKMLGDEFGTASNIKNRVNRQSVLGAITSAQQRLKLYNKVPARGLVLYTGTIVTDDGKEKKVLFLWKRPHVLKVMVDISVVSALRVQVKFFSQISIHRFLYLLHV